MVMVLIMIMVMVIVMVLVILILIVITIVIAIVIVIIVIIILTVVLYVILRDSGNYQSEFDRTIVCVYSRAKIPMARPNKQRYFSNLAKSESP